MIYPMFVMLLLTISVGLIAVKARSQAIRDGKLDIQYFALMQSQNLPEKVIKTTRCFNNLFELPTLFYAGCLLAIVINKITLVTLLLAWLFIVARLYQAYIHLTYNNVRHRILAFAGAMISVTGLWIALVISSL